LQTKYASRLQEWKRYVRTEAEKAWTGQPVAAAGFHLKLVYLYNDAPVDVDNIVKPIQDALDGLVYPSDILVTDVESHRRLLAGTYEIMRFPPLLLQGLLSGRECVYVAVYESGPIEDYL
jgi:Holliday junction resolvase RusA-like endonuclease